MIFIDNQQDFDAAMARVAAQPVVALDTEADSLHSYFDKVCLIQMSIPGEDLAEARQVELAQRIDDEIVAGNGDLDQADLVEVRMQRVGLGVDGDDAVLRDALHGIVEKRLFIDPNHRV